MPEPKSAAKPEAGTAGHGRRCTAVDYFASLPDSGSLPPSGLRARLADERNVARLEAYLGRALLYSPRVWPDAVRALATADARRWAELAAQLGQ